MLEANMLTPWLPMQVFYRETLERTLERQRDLELRAVCRLIYRIILTVVARRRFLKAKARIVQVQKFVRVSVEAAKVIGLRSLSVVLLCFLCV